MTSLAEFVLARIAEDQAHAEAATGPDATHWQWFTQDDHVQPDPLLDEYADAGGAIDLRTTEEFPTNYVGPLPRWALHNAEEVPAAAAVHIARWDPARVLAECEAKRRIVRKAREAIRLSDETPDDDSPRSERIHGYAQALEEVCEQLVRPYAEHADFDPEWAA